MSALRGAQPTRPSPGRAVVVTSSRREDAGVARARDLPIASTVAPPYASATDNWSPPALNVSVAVSNRHFVPRYVPPTIGRAIATWRSASHGRESVRHAPGRADGPEQGRKPFVTAVPEAPRYRPALGAIAARRRVPRAARQIARSRAGAGDEGEESDQRCHGRLQIESRQGRRPLRHGQCEGQRQLGRSNAVRPTVRTPSGGETSVRSHRTSVSPVRPDRNRIPRVLPVYFPSEIIVVPVVFAIPAIVLVVRMSLRHKEKMASLNSDGGRSLEIEARLERIEQAVDAVALEMERIGEGQRFVTKLLAERPTPISDAQSLQRGASTCQRPKKGRAWRILDAREGRRAWTRTTRASSPRCGYRGPLTSTWRPK